MDLFKSTFGGNNQPQQAAPEIEQPTNLNPRLTAVETDVNCLLVYGFKTSFKVKISIQLIIF